MKSQDCSCYYEQLASLEWNSIFEEQIKELCTHGYVAKCEALICHMCYDQISCGDVRCYCGEMVDETHFVNITPTTGVEK